MTTWNKVALNNDRVKRYIKVSFLGEGVESYMYIIVDLGPF